MISLYNHIVSQAYTMSPVISHNETARIKEEEGEKAAPKDSYNYTSANKREHSRKHAVREK